MDSIAAPPKPKTYTGDLANLPPALAVLTKQKRWLLWRWELSKQDDDLRELVFKKNNYGPKSNSIVLRYERGLFLPVPGMTSLDAAAHSARVDEVFMSLLRKLTEQGTELSPAWQSHSYAPTVMIKHAEAKGMRKRDLETALQRLLETRKVWMETLCPGTTREKKVLRAS